MMKKVLSLALIVSILLSAFAGLGVSTHAATPSSGQCGDNVYYTFNSSTGELVISGTGTMQGYSYGGSPFYYDSSIKKVEIQSGVTSIGSGAFRYCSGLTSITIPNSVTSIGDYAFSDCSGLTSITIPNSVTSIGDEAFQYCSGLTSIKIPNSVTNIGEWTFAHCRSLTSITIPNSVTWIGSYAFYDCSGLTSITIPASVTSIGSVAFAFCSGLTSITIPNSVTGIGSDAFSDCSGLTSITVNSSNTKYDSRGNCNAIIETATNTLIQGCKNTVIPNSVTSIGRYAFYDCSSLTSITIPDSITSIGSGAFRYCSGLTSITIPDSVTSIGDSAFFGCSSLTGITIPNSVTGIGSDAFYDCSGLTSITVNSSNTKYDSRGNCNAIIETATNTLIQGCKNTVIPNSVTSIGRYAFYDCSSLTSITIPDSITSIGSGAFRYCSGLTSITIPDSVTSIGDSAFFGCSSLTSITIPASVTSIGSFAFYGCSSLTGITIPSSVTSIGDYAFYSCSSLTSITIPASVTSIGSFAFYYCSGLTTVYYLGTEVQWNSIGIGSSNSELTKATRSYRSEPIGFISATNDLASSQTVTLTMGDDVGIAGYYWGTSSNYNSNSYTATTSTLASKTVSDPGTYYFTVKDTAGNVSGTYSITFCEITLSANGGSVSPSKLIVERGNRITMPVPTRAGYVYEGWHISDESAYETYYNHQSISSFKSLVVNESEDYFAIWSHTHNYATSLISRATTKANGEYAKYCTYGDCSEIEFYSIPYIKTVALAKTSYTYTGKAITPKVTVKDSKGKAIAASNYTVSYAKGRKAIGRYAVKITFKKNYSGTVTKYFNIVPKSTAVTKYAIFKHGSGRNNKAAIRLNWKKVSGVTGYQIQYSTNKQFKKPITAPVKNVSSYTRKKLNLNTKYYIRLRSYSKVKGKNYFSAWSKVYTVKTPR